MTCTKSLVEVMHRFDGYMPCAVTSLSWLRQYQSKRAEAGELLAPIYD